MKKPFLLLCVLAASLTTFADPAPNTDPRRIIHPPAAAPSINGPRVTGASPGKPFLFLIPATGQGPLRYAAEGLPAGLTLDPATGVISGVIEKPGAYVASVTVTGPQGTARRNLNIVAGEDKLALAPPLGWNSWNVWGTSITDAKVRAAADAMITSGLAAHGYQYVNIDDGWMSGKEKRAGIPMVIYRNYTHSWTSGRDADGNVLPNEKFPDMKALGDYVHQRGLKLGIYSSPGPKTCAVYEGSYGHERQDAETWATWGIDYVKYDLCSYGLTGYTITQKRNRKPYELMGEIIPTLNRDIVFSICQYGLAKVWTWGEQVGGNLWRTSGDVQDIWKSDSDWFPIGITHHFDKGELSQYAGPGHWNDPDMLVVGKVGWGPEVRDSRLDAEETITHITLWSMLAAPLLIGADMTDLDEFTLALLTNDEVLAVDQDPLGRAATRKALIGQTQVWSRPLWDGTQAVALFNLGEAPAPVTARWADLGISGKQPVRDLWRQAELGEADDSFTASVPRHGAILLRVGKPQKADFNYAEDMPQP